MCCPSISLVAHHRLNGYIINMLGLQFTPLIFQEWNPRPACPIVVGDDDQQVYAGHLATKTIRHPYIPTEVGPSFSTASRQFNTFLGGRERTTFSPKFFQQRIYQIRYFPQKTFLFFINGHFVWCILKVLTLWEYVK